MNRFQQHSETAMRSINHMQDEHSIGVRTMGEILSENRRLRFLLYKSTDRRHSETLVNAVRNSEQFARLDESLEENKKLALALRSHERRAADRDCYFDVVTWLWTCKMDMLPKLAIAEEYKR